MRAITLSALAAALVLAGSATARAPDANLCQAGESVEFNCKAGAKVISLCGSGDVIHYRFGRPGRPEMNFPASSQPARSVFHYSATGYSGGGEARVRFLNGAFEYVVYTANLAGDWHSDGTRDHEERYGVLVRKGGRNVANIRCTGGSDNDLYVLADRLPEEQFDYDVDR
jgi:hypothetical protein